LKTGVDSISALHEALQYDNRSDQLIPAPVNFQFPYQRKWTSTFDLSAGSDAPGGGSQPADSIINGFVVHEWREPENRRSRFVPALNLLLHASYDGFSNAA